MAYRKSRQSGQRKRRSAKTKTKQLVIPPVITREGETLQLPVLQMPQSSVVDQGCQLMNWGNSVGSPSSGNYGPDIQLNIAPPTDGQYSDITVADFLQYWGTTTAAGQYFLPASGTFNFNFQLLMWTGSPVPSNWYLMAVLPGLMWYSVRLFSKARVIRSNGSVEECWFELKNILPSYAFESNPPDGSDSGFGIGFGGGPFSGGTQQSWMLDGSEFLQNMGTEAYHYYFHVQNVPIDQCLWRLPGLTFHNSASNLGSVNGPNGNDANFGVDINQSIPFPNHFNYGDRIQLEGITAQINPFWGFEMCPYSFGVDWDGDGVTDDYYGTNLYDENGNLAGSVPAGGPLQTMLPSSPMQFFFTN